jgi:signal transduction histidine kinase
LAANLLIATRVLLARVDGRLDSELEHEYEKLRAFAERSGGSFGRADDLLAGYLASAVPEDDETYFSVIDDRPDRRSNNEPLARLDRDATFLAVVGQELQPTVGEWESSAGAVRYGVFPVEVEGDERRARLVVVEFAAPDRAETVATLRVLAVVSSVTLVAAGIVSWLVAGRLLRPVRAVSDTAEMISESDLSQRIAVSGDDDVADLARTFNRMLDRIEAAFEGQRRFLDDAGHELRTPITVVRGHLEVMGDDPDERVRAMPLVIDELARMGRIVDDLLVLARADRPDFLAPGPVDLADLTIEVVAKARPLGDRRWEVSEVAEATVVADGQRLTQALMQLVSNAVDHTSPGDRIAVGSAVRDGRVLLWVQDEGSGIAASDQRRIFERFATGSADGGPSTGLGLAIVRSIANAHRGVVRVDSAVGKGSTFTLELRVQSLDDAVMDEKATTT